MSRSAAENGRSPGRSQVAGLVRDGRAPTSWFLHALARRQSVEKRRSSQTVCRNEAFVGCDYAGRGGGVGGDSVRTSRNATETEAG
jgi:hypothetical protein